MKTRQSQLQFGAHMVRTVCALYAHHMRTINKYISYKCGVVLKVMVVLIVDMMDV